ncbi:MAG: hypothetical protein HYU65_05745, partial [Armatimonadetes bacterium]|nr:hypothetical protein [Armatimonadota bacterium]
AFGLPIAGVSTDHNVAVTGDTVFLYSAESGFVPYVLFRNRVQFTVRVGSLTAVSRIRLETFDFGDGASTLGTTEFDFAYVEWAASWGFNLRVGRQLFKLGPNGLLFDTVDSAGDYFDGARLLWTGGSLSMTAAVFRDTPALARDIWAFAARFTLVPGWTTRAYYYQARPHSGAASSTGWELDLGRTLVPGVRFAVDYATYNPAGAASSSAWRADVTFDLGTLAGMRSLAPTLQVFSKDYGASGAPGPAYSQAETTTFGSFSWNLRSWGAGLQVKLTPAWRGYVKYESGTIKNTTSTLAAGGSVVEWRVGAQYALGRGATVDIYYDRQHLGGSTGTQSFNIELNYPW